MAKDANEQELEDKMDALCDRTYGDHSLANMKRLFQSYDEDGNGGLKRDELERLLKDADIGNWVTRGYWLDGIFEKLDRSPQNSVITWEEYLAVSTASKDDVDKAKATQPATPAPPAPPTPPAPMATTITNSTWGSSTYLTYDECDPVTGLCLASEHKSSTGAVLAVGLAALAGLALSR